MTPLRPPTAIDAGRDDDTRTRLLPDANSSPPRRPYLIRQ